jgi:hypothetical protein
MAADDLKALFPNLSDAEAILAKENLGRYLLLAWEIYESDSSLVPNSPKLTDDKEADL